MKYITKINVVNYKYIIIIKRMEGVYMYSYFARFKSQGEEKSLHIKATSMRKAVWALTQFYRDAQLGLIMRIPYEQ